MTRQNEGLYCTDCGEDENITFVAQYASGDYWKCKSCGKGFHWEETEENDIEPNDLLGALVSGSDKVNIEKIKKKLRDYNAEVVASRGCCDMEDFTLDVAFLIVENERLLSIIEPLKHESEVTNKEYLLLKENHKEMYEELQSRGTQLIKFKSIIEQQDNLLSVVDSMVEGMRKPVEKTESGATKLILIDTMIKRYLYYKQHPSELKAFLQAIRK